MNITVFSGLFTDDVTLDKSYYEVFLKEAENSLYFDNEKINDLVFYAYQMCEEMEHSPSKRTMFRLLVDVLNEITIDEIVDLRHDEFKRLLFASKINYRAVYNDISDGPTCPFDSE